MRYYIFLLVALLSGMQCWGIPDKGTARLGGVEVWRAGERQRMAVYRLGDSIPITVHFDVIDQENEASIFYSFVHCNSDLQHSGFSEADLQLKWIRSPLFKGRESVGSPIPYKHYELTLPNNEVRFVRSGVYFLEAREWVGDSPLLRIPIFVHEGAGELKQIRLSQKESLCSPDMQSMEMSYEVPSQDKTLNMLEPNIRTYQNGSNLLPVVSTLNEVVSMSNKQYFRKEDGEAPCFPSGNRYLALDLSKCYKRRLGIDRWSTESGLPLAIIPQQDYRYTPPLRVRQKDRIVNRIKDKFWRQGQQRNGQYYLVRFSLKAPKGLDIYLEGSAFDYLPKAEKQLKYLVEEDIYTLTLPLKQGYHEYRYIGFDSSGKQYPLEGNYHETENQYTHLVYAEYFHSDRLLLVTEPN